MIEALDVGPQDSIEALEASAKAMLERVKDPDVLVLTDVVGATPCNLAQRLVDGRHVRVIAGVNVSMIWRVLCYAREPLEALAGRAITGATQGVVQLAATEPQATAPNTATTR